MKYTNAEYELLKNNEKRLNSTELSSLIKNIQQKYTTFSENRAKYTPNYISLMETTFNKFIVSNLLDSKYGGKLITEMQREQVALIVDKVRQYCEQIEQLKYFEFLSEEKRNVVLVGPNGCGKTTLLRHLRQVTGEDKIAYYQADRFLIINESYNPERDNDRFTSTYLTTDKYASDIENGSQVHYASQQINQTISLFERRRLSDLQKFFDHKINKDDCLSDKIIKHWNELIKDRELFFDMDLKVKTKDGKDYPIKYLSSGEKSILYFLINILIKDEKPYYFIDEPENNLNPAIVESLWNILESYHPNSTFVYLTHDANFVSSRINNKIYWIQKYDGTGWSYQPLPENNNLPQELMVSLVGNRQPVLFCESENENKYDAVLYKLMFPDFKVVAAGGCDKVIAKTKAYVQLGLPQQAYGIIDCDYKEDSFLSGQEANNVYHFPFFEIENMLFSEAIVREMIRRYSNASDYEKCFENLRQKVIVDFRAQKEIWIIRSIAFQLRSCSYKGKINSLKTIDELKSNYQSSIDVALIDTQYEELSKRFETICESNDYNTVLRYFDKKNLINEYEDILELKESVCYLVDVFDMLKDSTCAILKEFRNQYLPALR